MTARPVHWHEGMFLRPHHLQAAQRYWSQISQLGDKWDLHYNWGLREIVIDLDALSNYRCVIRTLKARLRDGTLVCVPEEGALPVLELKAAFAQENVVMVYLAVPVLQVGRANVSVNGRSDAVRYLLDVQELEDENTGLNPQPIQVRLLNLRLLTSTDDHSGYEVLPVARIRRSASADAVPELDTSYIPPILTCDAWRPLSEEILQNIYERLGRKLELQAHQVVSRGITFDSAAQGDAALFSQLRILNEAYALLGTQVFAKGIHPLSSYLELCRLVGQLAIIDPQLRRTPELPKYDHDDLGTCFNRVKQYIDNYLSLGEEPKYKERPFIGAGLRMQVALEPAWLESAWQIYIGVKSSLAAEDCIRLLTRSGPSGLDMKVGSSDNVDMIFTRGLPGLRFAPAPRPPRALPQTPGLVYFQLLPEASLQEWANVKKLLNMAIRLNENLVVGNIQGQRVLTIRNGGQTTTMQFTLFVVEQERQV